MEQSNLLNENIKQIKGMLGFLNPTTSFIINAAFAVVAFVLFILQDAGAGVFGSITLVSVLFKYAGGILGFLVLLGLLSLSVAGPLKAKKLCTGVNFFIIGFMFLFNLMGLLHWGIITILLLILILLPWALFTLLVKGDEVKL